MDLVWFPFCFCLSKMVVELEQAVKIFRDLARIPSATSGHISSSDHETYGVSSIWTQRDLERKEKVKFVRQDVIRVDGDKIKSLLNTGHQETANELFVVPSPSGKYTAIIRKVKNKKGDEKRYIEVWRDNYKWKNIDAEAMEKHGKIYENDAQFGALNWSTAEDKLVYVAEKKQPKTKSHFEKAPSEKDSSEKDVLKGEEFAYREDWGELLVGKHHPVVCIFDVQTEEITVLDGVSDQLSAGTPIWCPDDSGIIFAAWNHRPYRLGLIYCLMRKSGIYHYDLKSSTCTKLSGDDVSVFSPIFSPDGKYLLWVQMNEGGPHHQTCQLKKCEFANRVVSTVVDVVHEYTPASQAQSAFPGWYALALQRRCWSQDGRRLVLDNPWRFQNEVISVDVETGHVTRLTSDAEVGSWTVLDVYDDLVLAACSSPIHAKYLMIGKLPSSGAHVSWLKLTNDTPTFEEHSYKVQVHKIPHERLNSEFSSVTEFESLLVMPPGASPTNQIPLILYPHGGPHSNSIAGYRTEIMGFSLCGFAVLLVNFRGSTAYGQDFVWSLPGYVGDIDVKDCMQAMTDTLSSGVFDCTRLCVTGGSHGGLLTGHLIGQYPDVFRAAIAVNPVINIASMYHTSDIPDWVLVETHKHTDKKFDFGFIPGANDYEKFLEMSPIRYIDQVKTPMMLLIGVEDRRVPCNQGLEYHKQLLARNVPTRLLRYPESSHPLCEVDVEADIFINMFEWFHKYI